MKLAVTSDLHLGITRESTLTSLAEKVASEQPDLLVLAGDIGEGERAFRRALDLFRPVAPERAVLVGNHDLWAGHHSSRTLWEEILPGHARDADYIWLEAESIRSGRVAVVGSVAWYDYSAGDRQYPCTREEYRKLKSEVGNADAWRIDWDWEDPKFAETVSRGLVSRLGELQDSSEVDSIAVVTHVPLLEEQMVRIPGDRAWGISNAYFGNLTLGETVLAQSKVCALVSGHTHRARRGIRTGSEERPLYWEVIGSSYGRPAFTTVELNSHGVSNAGHEA